MVLKFQKITDVTYEKSPNFDIKKYLLHPLRIKKHLAQKIILDLDENYLELFESFIEPVASEISFEIKNNTVKFNTTNVVALFAWFFEHPKAIIRLGPALLHTQLQNYIKETSEIYKEKENVKRR